MKRQRSYGLDVIDEDGENFGPVRVRKNRARQESVDDARATWEPVVCWQCGEDHRDTSRVRLRRTTHGIEARCAVCGAVAARYAAGVWTS
jgi:hypothetical protein